MAAGIEIDFPVGSPGDVSRELMRNARAADAAAAAMKRLAAATKGAKTAAGSLSGSGRGGGVVGPGGSTYLLPPRGGRAMSPPKPPKPPPSFEARLSRFLRSTRFGADGVMPLIGQSADLFGLGKELPEIAALGVAAKAATEGLTAAAAAGKAFGDLQVQGGGSAQTTAALRNIGAGSGQAAAFNSRITSDPQAMAVAAGLGISNAPGMYGTQDWTGQYLKAVRAVRAITDPVQRLAKARALGIDDQLTMVSDSTFNRQTGADAQAQAQVFDPKFLRDSAEAQAAVDHIKQSFENLTVTIWKVPMGGYTKFANELSDMINGKMTWNRFLTGKGEDQFGNATDPNKATKDNTAAVKDLTQTIGIQGRQYGHGDRTDAAIPRSLGMGNSYALGQGLQAGAIRLGAFG